MNGWQALGFKTYQDYLDSDLWRDKRSFILKLRPICELCQQNKSTSVHHKTYASVGNENKNDVMALCFPCHSDIHNVEEWEWCCTNYQKINDVEAKVCVCGERR